MRIKARDWVATLLVAAVGVAYVGYLVRGEMPFIQDPRGMAATGLALGVAAYLVMTWGDAFDQLGKVETGLAAVAAALGILALAFAEAGIAEVLLAVFMASVALVWAVKAADHAGWLHGHTPTGLTR